MPPRKSDQRKSDVSTARFALKDDATPMDERPTESSSPQQQQKKQQSAAPESQGSAATPQPSTLEKKDSKEREKEKDKDAKDGKEAKDKDGHHKDAVTIEDLTLPKSIITRLAKGVLPANTQIQANAVLALSKSTTVFISYLASHANEHTVNSGKKTILPADVLKALEDTEFEFMKDRLEAEFSKFNAIQTEKRTSYRNKVKAAKADTSTQDAEMTDIGNDTAALDASTLSAATGAGAEPEASGPRSKKPRIDATTAAGAGAGVGAAAAAADGEHDDAETEDEEHVHDEDDEQDHNRDSDEDDDDDDEQDADEDGDDQRDPSGDETQDALEERNGSDEHDEALDGDESD